MTDHANRPRESAETDWSLTLRLAFAVLVVYALVSLAQILLGIRAGADAGRQWWAPAALVGVRSAYLAALTPMILYVGRRYRVQAPHRIARAALHAVIASLVTPGYAGAILVSRWLVLGAVDAAFWDTLVNRVDDVVLYYAVLLAISYAVDYYTEARQRELSAISLRYSMVEAQLNALRTQLQPHFLFNTLNGIAELVHRDPERADLMIARLGELLRRSLDQGHLQTLPLETELDTVRLYVSIQQVRYPETLCVDYGISPDVLDAVVPAFLLQPLVENAIQHGIGPAREGRVAVGARREHGELIIEVHDSGGGLTRDAVSEGTGLRNVRARLDHLYGAAYHLELRQDRGTGCTVARVSIPFLRGSPAIRQTVAPELRVPSIRTR